MRQAQITLFVIMGVFIVIGIAMISLLLTDSVDEQLAAYQELPSEISAVRESVETCIEERMLQMVQYIALQGGYLVPSNPMIKYEYGFQKLYIPYYYFNEERHIPSDEDLIKEMEKALPLFIESCFMMQDSGFDLEKKDAEGVYTVTLKEEGIAVVVEQPLEVTKGEMKTIVNVFMAEVHSPYYALVDFGRSIALDQFEDEICYTCLADKAEALGIVLKTENINVGEGMAVLFVLEKEEQFFIFGEFFGFEDIEEKFKILDPGEQTAIAGYPFTLQMQATRDVRGWDDNSNLFDITPQGVIAFTPEHDDLGKYPVRVTTIDDKGNEENVLFLLTIVSNRDVPLAPSFGPFVAKIDELFAYDMNLTGEEDFIEYIGMNDLFTIDAVKGNFSFIAEETGVFSYVYHVMNKETGAMDNGEITVIVR